MKLNKNIKQQKFYSQGTKNKLLIIFVFYFFTIASQNGYAYGCVPSYNPEHLWCNPVYTFIMDSGGGRNTTSFLNSLHLLLLCK